MTDNDCGKVMSACFGAAPRWADYGVPAPSISNFSYEVDAGLLRTPVDTGYARQRRRYTHRPTTYELTWRVTTSDLHAVENLIQERGYDWLYVPMVTGQVPKWMAVDHLIRMTSNLQVSLIEKDLWEANITAEQYKIDPRCLTAALSRLNALNIAGIASDNFIATAGQTAFTLGVAPSTSAVLVVMVNGALCHDPRDYTVAGTTLTFNLPLKAGDEVDTRRFTV